ncbi:MAG TPA: hypothetical protein DC058_11420, partial [Planctomycetaceae bacterium]|nr:hypothetical protein [Planctomycetaceae bacterium]
MIVSPPRPVPIASARARTRNRKEWFRPYEQGFSRLNPTAQWVSGTETQRVSHGGHSGRGDT